MVAAALGQIAAAGCASAALIVVDPFQTEEAQTADLWLQLRPGSDTDEAFVTRWTIGFEELRWHVRGYTLARAANITWLDPTDIVLCARRYATAGDGRHQRGPPAGQRSHASSCRPGRLRSAGAKPELDHLEVPYFMTLGVVGQHLERVFLHDPFGNMIELHQIGTCRCTKQGPVGAGTMT